MRIIVFGLAAIALSACGQPAQQPQAGACTRTATHEVAWSQDGAADVITAASAGPSCKQAVVTWTLRNAQGDALWVHAGTFYDMTAGGAPPADAPAVTNEQMDTFLAGWADVTLTRSSELPEWREGAASLSESVQGMSYDTPFDRETYEAMRARNLPQLCFAAAVEASHCLIMDPVSHSPTVIVMFGP
ncbi:hypothetical protein [Terricaulis sp.]|uniref:hypothetical protein n=1 Tax=Terricaulis sp. TaxID=2768686 RepID=UPI0037840294